MPQDPESDSPEFGRDALELALRAADIPPGRWGAERMERLTSAEREFYRWILSSFAACSASSVDALCDKAHSEVRGVVISVPEAIEAGRLVFGELLEAGR